MELLPHGNRPEDNQVYQEKWQHFSDEAHRKWGEQVLFAYKINHNPSSNLTDEGNALLPKTGQYALLPLEDIEPICGRYIVQLGPKMAVAIATPMHNRAEAIIANKETHSDVFRLVARNGENVARAYREFKK